MSRDIQPHQKKYSIEYVFDNPEKKDKIVSRLEKGYLERRVITELVDRLGDNPLTVCRENGKLLWKIGTTEANLEEPTSSTPFWMRRIAHFFNSFSEEYRAEFDRKIGVINKAYLDLLDNETEAQLAIEMEAARVQLEATQAAEKTAQISKLKNDIALKEQELSVLIDKFNETQDELGDIETLKKTVETAIVSHTQERVRIRQTLANLVQFNTDVEGFWFGTGNLTDEEEAVMKQLEIDLYGESKGQLHNEDNRTRAVTNLQRKIEAISGLLQLAGETFTEQLYRSHLDLIAAVPLEKEAYETKQAEIESLRAELLELDPHPELNVVEEQPIIIVNEPISQPAHAPSILAKFLDGSSKEIDHYGMIETQNLREVPFLNPKQLWSSIHANDAFYQNNVEPLLKAVTSILTSSPSAAHALFTKWEGKIKDIAKAWSLSGSADTNIDNIIPTPLLDIVKALNSFNNMVQFLSQSRINIQDLLQNFSQLNIPDDLEIRLAIPFSEARQVLESYIADPETTNLTLLFKNNSPIRNWPENCQFLMALLVMKMEASLVRAENDQNYRQETIEQLDKTISTSPPAVVNMLIGVAVSSKWAFNFALGTVKNFIPASREETVRLQDYQKTFFIPEPNKPQFQNAIEFSKTDKRKAFDTKLREFKVEALTDAFDAVLAKHTTNDEKIGQNGKEFNLQALTLQVNSRAESQKETFKATHAYFKELESPTSALASKKTAAEEAAGKTLIDSLQFFQSLTPILSRNSNYTTLLQTIDNTILPQIREEAPINLEQDPFFPWIERNIFLPLKEAL